jgi:hypothetical protein
MLYVGLMCITTQVVYADALNIQLSNKSARFIYASEVFGGQFGPTDLEVGAYFNEDDDTVAHLGLMVRNDSLDNPLIIAIGARAYYADAGNQLGQTPLTAGALALGGEILVIPNNLGGLGIGFHYFVAPSVTSFMDAEGFTEYGALVDYEITEQASVYVGYRKIEIEPETGADVVVDSSVIYGLILRF